MSASKPKVISSPLTRLLAKCRLRSSAVNIGLTQRVRNCEVSRCSSIGEPALRAMEVSVRNGATALTHMSASCVSSKAVGKGSLPPLAALSHLPDCGALTKRMDVRAPTRASKPRTGQAFTRKTCWCESIRGPCGCKVSTPEPPTTAQDASLRAADASAARACCEVLGACRWRSTEEIPWHTFRLLSEPSMRASADSRGSERSGAQPRLASLAPSPPAAAACCTREGGHC
mmetsp:Transcript_26088/g.66235  ORF Transcript_26088/g.66235 Transcript_26088/m.66235 type:complete len:230 (-) Transcript_26088:31-720(-)